MITLTIDEFIMIANVLDESRYAIKTIGVDINYTDAQTMLDTLCENGNGFELERFSRKDYYDSLWNKLSGIKNIATGGNNEK